MTLYIIIYFLSFYLFTYISIDTIIKNKKNRNDYLFYYISIYVLSFIIPAFYYHFNNYIISLFLSITLFYFSTILTYKLTKVYFHNIYYLVLFPAFLYFNVCYILASILLNQ